MRRREPGFPIFRAEHEMVVQREMRRSHAGSFQIGRRMAIANSAPVPEARKKLAGGATTGSARPTTPNRRRALEGREKGTRGVRRAISPGDIRTLLAPLPGRIPNLGWWGGPVPVVPGRSATFTTG